MGNHSSRRRQEEERQRQKEEFERQQRETEEERLQRIEREVRELEEAWKLQILPQRQQPEKISELTLEQHDQLLLFTLFTDDRRLENKVCQQLPIVNIVDLMGSFVSQKYKTNIKEIEMKNGSYAATKRMLRLATVQKLKTGWSRQLLQTITTLDVKDVADLISPKQADLEEFNKRIGIPRNSLLEQITDQLRTHCGILLSPLGKKDADSESVPVVHPKLCVSVNHLEKMTADGTYTQSGEGRQAYEYAPRISFNDVTKSDLQTSESTNKFSSVMRKHHGLFLFLIGAAGSGKTTITKRVVKSWIEENKMAFLIPFAQIDKDERKSLKNLLTKFLCRLHNLEHDPSEEEIDQAFHWILDNQDKCLLILDGLDQSSFEIRNQPIEDPDINGDFLPGDLMSLLMSRKFLPNCRLILSSRPHSLVQFDPVIQPNIVVFLNDLLSKDVEKLMDHYLEHGTATEIMKKLRFKSPRIHQLIFTPLFLRLVAMLNNEVGEEIWTYVNTTAKLFFEVIERLQLSAHHECGLDVDDVKVLNLKLAEMAFYKTKQGSVVFEQNDLERYGLNGENVQDFLFGVMSSKQNTALLVGLVMVFYFNHQSTQEFFSARFAVEKLAFGEFKKFVKKLFPRLQNDKYGFLKADEDSFAILRVLTIGCLNEINSRQLDGEEILVKKSFFINFLCDHLRMIFVKEGASDVVKHQVQMFVDSLDFREEGVVREIREHLKDVKFRFRYDDGSSLNVAAHREGFFHFVQHFVSNVQYLSLYIREWNDHEVRKLFRTIQHSSPKIEVMLIDIKAQQLEHVSDVVAILPHLTTKLLLRLRGGDVDVDLRRFCGKLEEEIIHFDTSTLHTQELKVEVWYGFSPSTLEVYLRRGEPPQIIYEF